MDPLHGSSLRYIFVWFRVCCSSNLDPHTWWRLIDRFHVPVEFSFALEHNQDSNLVFLIDIWLLCYCANPPQTRDRSFLKINTFTTQFNWLIDWQMLCFILYLNVAFAKCLFSKNCNFLLTRRMDLTRCREGQTQPTST